MIRVIMKETEEYEIIMKFFMDNELEFSDEEPVPTDLIKCWKLVHGKEESLIGAIALAKREGEFIIDGIAIEKTYRNFDLGKILLQKAISEVKKLGGQKLYLVARAPEFFRKSGFITVNRDDAPTFFECLTCPQYGVDCHPEVMLLEV